MTDVDLHDTENTDAARPAPKSTNTVSANTVNGVVQAGVITGGIHHHLPTPRPPTPTPRQLASAPAGFVGRADQLAALDRALSGPTNFSSKSPRQVATAVISAIGTSGIGKTWLALSWAHHNLDRFPDGQLSVDLRGFSPGDPIQPADALAEFLAALGVDRNHHPTDLDARAALYRTRTCWPAFWMRMNMPVGGIEREDVPRAWCAAAA